MGQAGTIDVDTFSVSRARRMLAMLDDDPELLDDDDLLPRRWHGAMFAPATRPCPAPEAVVT